MKIGRLVKRGDLFYLNFGNTVGSEQSGVRPVIVVSNKKANQHSPTILVSPVTSRFSKKELPTHVKLDYKKCGLLRDSQVLLEQIYTVDKVRLGTYIGSVDEETMDKINLAAEISIEVGSAKEIYESREIKKIKEKVNYIKKIDDFIKMWFDMNNDMSPIIKYFEEREIRIKDLEGYAESYGIDYREYYIISDNRNDLKESKLNVMVG